MQASRCAVNRQSHLIAVVGVLLITVVVVGCAGVRSGGSQEEEQARTEATKEQTRSPEATASEEARCDGTRTYKINPAPPMTTNDLPGCPKGGLLSGTDDKDYLDGKKGADEIHGLGASDYIAGGSGSDIIYGGPGFRSTLWGGEGDDVIYGGDGIDNVFGEEGEDVLHGGHGNDSVRATSHISEDGQRDKLYCGPGKDAYVAGKLDYVDSSCEVKQTVFGGHG